MSLSNLKPGIPKKSSKRVGRGNGSGHGTYSCRGMKGQSARSGGRRRPGFEGGQTPYLQRMPKMKGFKNPKRVEYQVVNVGQLNIFDDGATVSLDDLKAKNLVSRKNTPVKLLAGKGKLDKKVTITVHKASAQAMEMVKSKKGEVKIVTVNSVKTDVAEKEEKKKKESPKKAEKVEETKEN